MGPSLTHVLLALAIQVVVGAAYGALGAGALTPWIGATGGASGGIGIGGGRFSGGRNSASSRFR